MEVLLHTSPISKYTRNTDMRYLYKFIDGNSFFPNTTFHINSDYLTGSIDLLQITGQRLLSKIGISTQKNSHLYYLSCLSYLPIFQERNCNCEIILVHGNFPISNSKKLPAIIWETGMLGLEYLKNYYFHPEEAELAWKIEKEQKLRLGKKAAFIGISHPEAADRFRKYLPSLAEKVRVLPPFLPHIKLSDWSEIVNKHKERSKVKLTFIGNQAKRKGLTELYFALQKLPSELQEILEVTVVSAFRDGLVPVPSNLNITYHHDLNSSEINSILENTHIYCMPSKNEAYGFVYIEAMATGCVVIAPRREPQDYILDQGKAGLLVDPNDLEELVFALKTAIMEPEHCLELVKNAWHRVHNLLGPEASAAQYMRVFQEVVSSERE
ncbi:MAG: glycosyltransferase family 4 protein [Scytonematopsis contorta HA4267-MV1]|jgi:glycosyltransferase involved in cell wall biosynthesis|nr:glycosyltransferase family 4 protein [Scytonematopsis contorta HA4267-MV1]